MAWQIRRTDEIDGSDQIQGITHPTAAIAYDVAMDDVQAIGKARLQADPSFQGYKVKFTRDNNGNKGFHINMTSVTGARVEWFVTEV